MQWWFQLHSHCSCLTPWRTPEPVKPHILSNKLSDTISTRPSNPIRRQTDPVGVPPDLSNLYTRRPNPNLQFRLVVCGNATRLQGKPGNSILDGQAPIGTSSLQTCKTGATRDRITESLDARDQLSSPLQIVMRATVSARAWPHARVVCCRACLLASASLRSSCCRKRLSPSSPPRCGTKHE
jgi:hypothetical protein